MNNILTLETNKYAIKLQNFEGPLDLLCHLIDKNKMNICDIKISEITDQYIEYLNKMEQMNLEITSEFLIMASTLLYLKSKSLLPSIEEDEKGISEEELIRRIIEYKKYKEITKKLKEAFLVNSNRLFKMPEENFAIDLTIARGLDYYTGTVYETFLNDYRELGSVCSGGRYENLAENYTDKKLPGVGVSIGLTRLFYKLNELNIIKADKKSISDILIIPMTENMSVPLELGTELRKLKVNTEIYLNNKKIKAKMKYADKLEIPYVVVIGDNEIETSKVKVKEMATGKETECELDAKEILNVIRRK